MNEAMSFMKAHPSTFMKLVMEGCSYPIDELEWRCKDGDFSVTVMGHVVFIACVSSEGGNEGEGDHAERVFSINFSGPDCRSPAVAFLQVTGFYSSYEGTTWDEKWVEVEPREVTVTKYFPVSDGMSGDSGSI